ncbi:hypothetical protein KKC32_04320 [Patescibacteria group bacterium]|nr:hypothetical protein [Patescibacteria group bacterium]
MNQTKSNENGSSPMKAYLILFGFLAVAALILGGIKFTSWVKQKQPQILAQQVVAEESESVGNDNAPEAPNSYDFQLDHTAYNAESIRVIAEFENIEEENWEGTAVYDDKVFYEGQRSLALISNNRGLAFAELERKMDLSDAEYFEVMLHLNDFTAFESIGLDFGDENFEDYYHYNFTNLRNGWNLVQMPRKDFVLNKAEESIFDWSSVEKVKFEVISRPDAILLARVDKLRAVIDDNSYLRDWNIIKRAEKMLFTLERREDNMVLTARSQGTTIATLKKLENQDNFTFSASLSPQTAGRSGLFVRGDHLNGFGYYFLIFGNQRNTWQIFKKNSKGYASKDEIISGTLENVVFSKNKKYWLRVDARGSLMQYYISFDGKEFSKLGEFDDDEFKRGEVGIAYFDAGITLFDDIKFKAD